MKPFSARRSSAIALALSTAAILLVPAVLPILVDAAPRKFRGVRFGIDVRLGGDAGPYQSEPAIAVNPASPGNMVAGFIDYADRPRQDGVRTTSTTDGGATWTASAAAPQQDTRNVSGDPSVAGDAAGNLYHAYLEFGVTGSTANDVDVLVARSTDGGRTFPTFTVAAAHSDTASFDKPYMTVDVQPKSRFKGTIYVATMDFFSGVKIVVSRDGAATWSAPLLIAPFPANPTGFSQSPLPVVAPDGTAYVFYAEYDSFREPRVTSILYVRSRDGGRTWSAIAAVASNLPSPGEFTLKNADPDFGSTLGSGVQAFSFPSAAIAPNGNIFVVWVDFPRGSCQFLGGSPSPCTNADVRLSVSKDGARSWSAPVVVNDDAGPNDQFFPWIATHPDGLASIMWLDRRLDSHNLDFDLYYTNTYDGQSFLPDVRVNTLPSLLGTQFFIGDYQGMAATADGVFPVWNDLRSGTPAVFLARGTLGP
jgi:hypothetical protein